MLGSLERAAIEQMMREEMARKQTIARAWEAYNGIFPNPLHRKPGTANDNVKVNRVRAIVDASVSLLASTPPGYELPKEDDGEDTVEESPAEEDLEECLDATGYEAKLLDFAINGAICGTAYWHIVPDDPYPRLQVIDPSCMTIRWDPRDLDVVTAYIFQFNSIDPATHKPRVDRQLCERQVDAAGKVTHWLITDQHADLEGAQNADWITDGTPTIWNYTWAPYLHCKNLPAPNQVYGLPDYSETVIELNRAINFSYSNRRKIDRLHGHPKTWAKGLDGVSISVGVDEIVRLEGEEAAIGQLVPGVNSDAAASLGKQLDEAIEMETMTPALLLGRDDGSSLPPSGVALKIRMWPATMKLEMKRKLYGPMIVELYRRLLALMGYGEDMRVELSWPEPLPVDPESERKVLLIDQQLGASAETLLTKAGYDYETEKTRKEAEGASEGENALSGAINGPGMNMPPVQPGSPVDQAAPLSPMDAEGGIKGVVGA